jgi:two-component system, LytTR family, sensor kinase
MTVESCYLIFITVDYYVVNNLIVPKLLIKRKYAFFILMTILVIAISAWLRALIAIQMNKFYFHKISIADFKTVYLNSVVNISLWVLMITIGKMLVDRIQTHRQLELLEKERVKNELDYLKAQINPHALFNSLNTIYGHIDKNNQLARNILLQFSELLRYQLYDCGAEKVNLDEEMDYIKNYITFQKLRKDEKLKVNVQIRDINKGLKIAPLLLVVLIENAFKFVSNYSEKENKICIKISMEGNYLYSSFKNTKDLSQPDSAKNSKGIGISNLKRRLELLYAGKYVLATRMDGDYYETDLKINLT